jgi:hypothetical protein
MQCHAAAAFPVSRTGLKVTVNVRMSAGGNLGGRPILQDRFKGDRQRSGERVCLVSE